MTSQLLRSMSLFGVCKVHRWSRGWRLQRCTGATLESPAFCTFLSKLFCLGSQPSYVS